MGRDPRLCLVFEVSGDARLLKDFNHKGRKELPQRSQRGINQCLHFVMLGECRGCTRGECIRAPGCWCCFLPVCRLQFSPYPICTFLAGSRSLRCWLPCCGGGNRIRCSFGPESSCSLPGQARPFFSPTAAAFSGTPEPATGSTTPCASTAVWVPRPPSGSCFFFASISLCITASSAC